MKTACFQICFYNIHQNNTFSANEYIHYYLFVAFETDTYPYRFPSKHEQCLKVWIFITQYIIHILCKYTQTIKASHATSEEPPVHK